MTVDSSFMSRRLVSGSSIARRIQQLDPVTQNEEATHLSLEVRYGDAFFIHGAYTVAFARTIAIPTIARMLYRTGTGDVMYDARKRTDDTLLFFGEMLRHGHSSAHTRRVIDRMEEIHGKYGAAITHDDKLYTLGTLAFEPDRIERNLGLTVFTETERQARFHFWREVGLYMGLSVPDTYDDMFNWIIGYEDANYEFTEGAAAILVELQKDWRNRWFKGPTAGMSDHVLNMLFDDALRGALHLDQPPASYQRFMPPVVRAYLGFQAIRPHRPHRSWSDHFGAKHPRPLDVPTMGHRTRLEAVSR